MTQFVLTGSERIELETELDDFDADVEAEWSFDLGPKERRELAAWQNAAGLKRTRYSLAVNPDELDWR